MSVTIKIHVFPIMYTRGDPKIPGIVKKKNYLEESYQFETLVPFKVLPL